jgi:ribosomal protein S18 acetylase RimI-like enzyme
MMTTSRFRPTPAWRHALAVPNCPHHLLLVAVMNGHVVGWCRLFPEQCGDGKDQVELGIGVTHTWRGRGIGSALLRHALGWAEERGLARVVLNTGVDNQPAIRLFTRSGFRTVGQDEGLLEMFASLPGTV